MRLPNKNLQEYKMAVFSSNNKDLWMYKGDTGNILFTGLPKDKLYTVYLSIFDEDGDKILNEIAATSFNQSTGVASFIIDETISNDFKVGEFTYALKICADGSEDTVIPETKLENGIYSQEAAPSFTVYAKRVEGD